MNRWFQSVTGALNLLLEARCTLCERSTPHLFCKDCLQRLERCQFPNPQQFWEPPLPVFAWGQYGGTLKQAIAVLKYQNRPDLARPLGQKLAQTWLASPMGRERSLVVVPIPMHREKQRKRGFNQAELLASAFCEVTGLPLKTHGLVRIRATEAQFGLSVAERQANLADAFQLGQAFQAQRPRSAVLLLDDIYTTGATAREAAMVLQQAKISVYGLAAIARPVL